MVFKGKDTRAEKRYSFRMTVECSYDAEECDMEMQGPLKTFTSDISHSGMGFYSECPAHEGQIVKVFLKYVYKEPILAEVRWCNKHIDNLYRIGIRYLAPMPGDFSPPG